MGRFSWAGADRNSSVRDRFGLYKLDEVCEEGATVGEQRCEVSHTTGCAGALANNNEAVRALISPPKLIGDLANNIGH